MMATVGRLVVSHRTVGRLFHRLVHRGVYDHRFAERGCWVCRAVWSWMLADGTLGVTLAQATRDSREHRTYRLSPNLALQMPHPDWPLDGEQPTSPRGVWVER